MARMGYCPSGRLFEAAACGVPILTDYWEGLERFFEPEKEIVVAKNTEDAVAALSLPHHELSKIATRARQRTLAEHTADNRAEDFEAAIETAFETKTGVPNQEKNMLLASGASHSFAHANPSLTEQQHSPLPVSKP